MLLLAIPISSCGKVVATTQTSATSTDVPVVEYPSWGVPTDQPPLFFYASDIPQRTRDRVEETLLKAAQYWPNYGPLEIWVPGIQTMPIVELVNEYCARRVELNQIEKFACLDQNRNSQFEEFRKWSAISAFNGENTYHGELTDTAKYGFLQITLANPVGFTDQFAEYSALHQQVIFHEYFHVVQSSAISNDADIAGDPSHRKKLFGPPWFLEGSAEYMSLSAVTNLRFRAELPLYDGTLEDLDFQNVMVEKLERAKTGLIKKKDFALRDATYWNDYVSPYDIGPWAIAYLIHKTGPNVLLDTFYPNLNRLGWVGSFKLSFGMSPAQFQSEFLNFMKLTTDEQSKIL